MQVGGFLSFSITFMLNLFLVSTENNEKYSIIIADNLNSVVKKHTITIIPWALEVLIFVGMIGLLYLTGAAQPPTHPCSLTQIKIIFSTLILQAYKLTGRRCLHLTSSVNLKV